MINSEPMRSNMPMLGEDASGTFLTVLDEIKQQKLSPADTDLSLDLRVEMFEDIIASEVGDTLLVRARNIEREIGLRQVFLKFEGGNPSGTQKDRIAFAQVHDALRRDYDTITLATCGNYGSAVSFAASLAGIKCRVFIPECYRTKREEEIRNFGAEIIRKGRDYEESVQFSRKEANDKKYYDSNPGGENIGLQLKAYSQIAVEIFDELRDAPYAVAIPVSNGTTLAGIHRGFLNLYRRGKTSRIPRIIAGSTSKKNPIVASFLKQLPKCQDLNPEKLHESPINEPLINWHSIDGDLALNAIYSSKGWAGDASDKSMKDFSKLIKEKEGIYTLPASTAGLIALHKHIPEESLPGDRYVVVLTGRTV
ncbi:MAG: pyridoxal-phosphate dependent enzyme [Spirochaetia bacterium]|jgi:threonine synthase|nr:pyridoxal-phosphate dependent enzyme [Spirochaetia bacterium]